MCENVHKRPTASGRKPAITPEQLERAVREYQAAERGGVYPLFMRLAQEFGCHFRTVQNAVTKAIKTENDAA